MTTLLDAYTNFEPGAWLAAIVDSSSDAILSKTLDGTITSWNAGAERLFGFTAEQAIGQPITLIIPEERLHEESDIIAKLRAGEKIERFETVRRRVDGSFVHIEVTISPVRDASGKIVGASKIARDISDRHRHAQELNLILREMQHRIKNLLTIIQALVSIGRRKARDVDTFARDLSQRIASLGSAQQLILVKPGEQEPIASLNKVIESVLAPYLHDGRVKITATSLTIGPQTVTSLALLMHELATNAVKYGGLSTLEGSLSIRIEEEGDMILIDWRERGGSRDTGGQGFGTELLGAALQGLGGTMESGWQDRDRVVCIRLPRERLAR